jgi:formamidopyrimidine-DNA glycosylase
MPELPEVENVRRGLAGLVGETLEEVVVRCVRIIRMPQDPALFARMLQGETLRGLQRRGKYLLFRFDAHTLVSHLRMEGKFLLPEPLGLEQPDKHTHVLFRFVSGNQLWYRDVRKFGTMDVVPRCREHEHPGLASLGPEPLDETLTPDLFRKSLARPVAVKKLLLDQTVVAGLGNIYVDESLLAAGIHPLRPGLSLKRGETARLLEAIRGILTKAIEAGGATVRSYRNSEGRPGLMQDQLLAYGRAGQPCRICGHTIEKMVVGGRGTHVCPVCQKLPRSGGSVSLRGSRHRM